jgi:hypothetical protein
MSYFKELDLLIQARTEYNPETRANETSYTLFKDEINEHIQGRITFEQLSPIAQDLMRDWESYCESEAQAEFDQHPPSWYEYNEETENFDEERRHSEQN